MADPKKYPVLPQVKFRTGRDEIPEIDRFINAERAARVTPDERVELLNEAAARGDVADELEGQLPTGRPRVREGFGAPLPKAQPTITDQTLAAFLPKTALAYDPRDQLALMGRAALPESLEEYLASGLSEEALEALGGADAATPYRQAQQRADIEFGRTVLEVPARLQRYAAERSGPARVAKKVFGEEAVTDALDAFMPARPLTEGALSEVYDAGLDWRFPEAKRATPNEPTTLGDTGVPIESKPEAFMRGLGAVAALAQETGAALPTLGVTLDDESAGLAGNRLALEASRRVKEGESFKDVAADLWERTGVDVMPLEQSTFGTTPEERGLLSDESLAGRLWPTKVWMRAMHKTERGSGVAEDMQGAAELFTRQVQAEYPELVESQQWEVARERAHTWAWRMGLVGDLAVPWEAPVGKAARVARQTGKVAEAAGTSRAQALGHVLGGSRMDAPHIQADAIAARLEGTENIDDVMASLPDELQDDIRVLLSDEPELPPPPPKATPEDAPPAQAAPDAPEAPPAPPKPPPGPVPEKVSSMQEWRDGFRNVRAGDEARQATGEARPAGFSGAEGQAASMLRWMEPDRTIQTPEYRLLGTVDGTPGKVVVEGDLDKVMKAMVGRSKADDVVMFRDTRDVASWQQRATKRYERGTLRSNWHFAQPDESALIKGLEAKLPTTLSMGVPPEVWASLKHKGHDLRESLRDFASAFQGRPRTPQTRHLDEEHLEFVGAVEQALRQRVRSTFGTEDLVSPLRGISLAREEWAPIERNLRRTAESTGWEFERLAKGATKKDGVTILHLDDADQEGLRKFGETFGRAPNVRAEMPVSELLEMQEGIIEEIAAKVTDRRLAVRETGTISTEIMQALSQGGTTAARLLTRSSKEALPWFDNAKQLRLMDHGARQVFDGARKRLGNIGRELVADLRTVKGTPSEKLSALLKEFRPVSPRERALVKRVEDMPAEMAQFDLDQLQLEVLNLVGDSLRSEIPGLYAKNARSVRAGLRDYKDLRHAEEERLGRKVLKAAVPEGAGVDPRRLKDVTGADARAAWRAFTDDGLDSPLFDRVYRSTDLYGPEMQGGVRPGKDTQLLNLALALKQDEVMRDVADDLVKAKIGTKNPQMAAIINEVMAGGTGAGKFTAAEMAYGRVWLRKFGVSPGNQFMLDDFHGVNLPEGLVAELKSAMNSGVVVPAGEIRLAEAWRSGDPLRVLRELVNRSPEGMAFGLRTHKDLLTTANPAYHLTNILGIPFIAVTQLGMQGSGRAMGAIYRNSELVKELSGRLSGGIRYKPPSDRASVLVTRDGRMYDVDQLEREMLRRDVAVSLQVADNSRSLGADLDRAAMEDDTWQWLMRDSPRKVRDGTIAVSDTIERQFRTGVFLDSLQRGSSLDEAAVAARNSLYDYGSLTHFEQKWMRLGVMFYAFHKKNTEAFIKALIDHPERIGTMVRAGQRQREAWLGDEKNVRSTDLARVVIARWQGADDRVWRVESGAVNSPAEGAVMLQRLARALVARDREAWAELSQMSNPVLDAAGRLVWDVDIGTGFRASTPGGNTVPEYLAVLLHELGLEGMLELKRESPPPHQARDKMHEVVAGQPKRWEATGDRGKATWQLWKVLAGRVTGDTAVDALTGASVFARALDYDMEWLVNERGHGSDIADLAQAAGFLVKPEPGDSMTEARTRQASEIRKFASDERQEADIQ